MSEEAPSQHNDNPSEEAKVNTSLAKTTLSELKGDSGILQPIPRRPTSRRATSRITTCSPSPTSRSATLSSSPASSNQRPPTPSQGSGPPPATPIAGKEKPPTHESDTMYSHQSEFKYSSSGALLVFATPPNLSRVYETQSHDLESQYHALESELCTRHLESHYHAHGSQSRARESQHDARDFDGSRVPLREDMDGNSIPSTNGPTSAAGGSDANRQPQKESKQQDAT